MTEMTCCKGVELRHRPDQSRRLGADRGFQEVYRTGKAGESHHPGLEEVSGQEVQSQR